MAGSTRNDQIQLKTNFEVDRKFDAFYTGGKLQLTSDGEFMFCGCGNKVTVVEISTGRVTTSFGHKSGEDVTRFSLTPDDEFIILATSNFLLRQFDWRNNRHVRTWKTLHRAAITSMAFDPSSTLLATGSADSSIKLWDIRKECCTHNIQGHRGVVSIVKFHPDVEKMWLFSAGDDYKLRVWNLNTSSCIAEIDVHVSTVTCICFSEDGNIMYSSSRDSTVAMLDVNKLKVLKTIPMFEELESVILLPETQHIKGLEKEDAKSPYILTMGSKGLLKVWDMNKAKCVMVRESNICHEDTGVIDAIHTASKNTLTVATFNQYIVQIDMADLTLTKQFCGYADEVLDVQFLGDDDSHIIMATNSEYIKVYDVATWNCQIVQGHTDIVLSLCVHKNKHLIATSSKDNSVRVWRFTQQTGQVKCVAIGKGHTQAVGAVAFSCLNANILVTGGMDTTVKMWEVPDKLDPDTVVNLQSKFTEKAHSKDINSVAISPNDKYIATASQDKTAKLWSAKSLTRLGVMRGHRKGIWCVQFSPVDQCLVTSSSDGTIKIWSVTNFSNVKTFQGHASSVLRVTFISQGMQLLSCSDTKRLVSEITSLEICPFLVTQTFPSLKQFLHKGGSDGLMKLWTIKSNECVKTFDRHDNKVWALAINKFEDTVITGGADSTIVVWKDVSEADAVQKTTYWEKIVLQEQKLSNLIHQKKYLKAIGIAITLEQPFKLLKIMKGIMSQENGSENLRTTLDKLRLDQIDKVLQFSSQWNTNSRHCHEAQVVLSSILQSFSLEELRKFPSIRATVEGLLPYTERHFQRMNRLLQQAQFVEYTWQCMRTASDATLDSSVIEVSGEALPVSPWMVDRKPGVLTESADEKDNDDNGESNDESGDTNDECGDEEKDSSLKDDDDDTSDSDEGEEEKEISDIEDQRKSSINNKQHLGRKRRKSNERDYLPEQKGRKFTKDSGKKSSKSHQIDSTEQSLIKKAKTSKKVSPRRSRQRKKTHKVQG